MLDHLFKYNYAGNIRELQNIIQRYLTLGKINFISPLKKEKHSDDVFSVSDADQMDLKKAVKHFESWYLKKKLNEFNGNRTQCAKSLNIGRRTLHQKISDYNI